MEPTLVELAEDFSRLTISSISPRPAIIEGTLCGMNFTLRYRCGDATLNVGGGKLDPLYSAQAEYGDEWSSTLAPTDVSQLLELLIPKLTRAARQWSFPSLDGETHHGWGHSAEQALEGLRASYRIAGLDIPQIEDVSFTIEDRQWPLVDPDFAACLRPQH